MRGRCWATTVTIVVLCATALVTIERGEAAHATIPRASNGVDAQTRTARDLLAYVPADVRGRCTDDDFHPDDQVFTQAVVSSFSAALDCTTAAGEEAFYFKFDNRAGADAYLETVVTVDNYRDASTNLSDCPSATTYTVTEGQKTRRGGRVFCFLAGEGNPSNLPADTQVVTWTDERLGIVAEAFNPQQPEHVHTFFAHDAGPLTRPDRSGIPPLPAVDVLRARGTALLALVPKASVRGCTIVNDFSKDALGSLYVWRLWIVADVAKCHPVGGPQEVEYIRFANADAMNEYYADTPDPDPGAGADVQTLHGITCPGVNPYNADGHEAGGVKCFFASIESNGRPSVDQYFHMVWSSKPTKVVASSISPAGDERAAMDWWAKRGGPNVG